MKTATADLGPIVGNNLRRLRSERGWSLEMMAKQSGVSRAMLGQIELGQSTPTINVLWKVAQAFELPFSALLATSQSAHPRTQVLRRTDSKPLQSADGAFSSRALFPIDKAHQPPAVEFYELTLTVGGVEHADAHGAGTREQVVVATGALMMEVGDEVHALAAGDAMVFAADLPHVYRQHGPLPTVLYLVMTYAP